MMQFILSLSVSKQTWALRSWEDILFVVVVWVFQIVPHYSTKLAQDSWCSCISSWVLVGMHFSAQHPIIIYTPYFNFEFIEINKTSSTRIKILRVGKSSMAEHLPSMFQGSEFNPQHWFLKKARCCGVNRRTCKQESKFIFLGMYWIWGQPGVI